MPIYRGKFYDYGIISRVAAQEFKYPEPYIMISIGEPGQADNPLRDDPNRLAVLRLNFDDIDNPNPVLIGAIEENPRAWQLMSDEQAADVVGFVEEWKDDVKLIVCHCAAGISRSAGVIAALTLWLEGREDEKIYKNHSPNQWVKSRILRALKIHHGMTDLGV